MGLLKIKKIIIFCLFSLSTLAGTEEHVFLNPHDVGPDLPLVGRSLFEELVTNSKGQIEIPFPFEKLTHFLQNYNNITRTRAGILVPVGRSLQRPTDIEPHPFENPRLLLSFQEKPASQLASPLSFKRKLFIGYLEHKKQVEIISYNESAGRMEFQIITDYSSSQNAKLQNMPRQVCLSCHKNKGPILAIAPWSENQNNKFIQEGLFAALKTDSFHGIKIKDHSGGQISQFDFDVRDSEQLLRLQRLWQFSCDELNSIGWKLKALKMMLLNQMQLVFSSENLMCPGKGIDSLVHFTSRLKDRKVFTSSEKLEDVSRLVYDPLFLQDKVSDVNENLFESDKDLVGINPKKQSEFNKEINSSLGPLVQTLSRVFLEKNTLFNFYRRENDFSDEIKTAHEKELRALLVRKNKRSVSFRGRIFKHHQFKVHIDLHRRNTSEVNLLDEKVNCLNIREAFLCESENVRLFLPNSPLTLHKDYLSSFGKFGKFICHKRLVGKGFERGQLDFSCSKIDFHQLFRDLKLIFLNNQDSFKRVFSDRELLHEFYKLHDSSFEGVKKWKLKTQVPLFIKEEENNVDLPDVLKKAPKVFSPFINHCSSCHMKKGRGPNFLEKETLSEVSKSLLKYRRAIIYRVGDRKDMPLGIQMEDSKREFFTDPNTYLRIKDHVK